MSIRFSLGSRLRSVINRQDGVSAVEFALALPVLFLLVLGVLEFGTLMVVSILVEGGLREASRYGITGSQFGGLSREQAIQQIVLQHSQGLINNNSLAIQTKVYQNFDEIGSEEQCLVASCDENSPPSDYTDNNGNGQYDGDPGVPGTGGANEIVLYTATYNWRFFTALFRDLVGDNNGTISMEAAIAVRNEPF